ncbi:hypothetical protein PUN28_016954 [Cardiocondyla obscurior]|uniref:Uncharacterized protein n=1 Tax=Cardiocondyla obscurior TaxID=286306 RepID=A0AAW2EMD3_9HYME
MVWRKKYRGGKKRRERAEIYRRLRYLIAAEKEAANHPSSSPPPSSFGAPEKTAPKDPQPGPSKPRGPRILTIQKGHFITVHRPPRIIETIDLTTSDTEVEVLGENPPKTIDRLFNKIISNCTPKENKS